MSCVYPCGCVSVRVCFSALKHPWRTVRGNCVQATVSNDADVLEAVNVAQFPDGRGVAPAAIFGNSVVYDEGGRITAARVMMQVRRACPRPCACLMFSRLCLCDSLVLGVVCRAMHKLPPVSRTLWRKLWEVWEKMVKILPKAVGERDGHQQVQPQSEGLGQHRTPHASGYLALCLGCVLKGCLLLLRSAAGLKSFC